MPPIVCEHGSYEEWKADMPNNASVHYSLTTPGQVFVCVYFDGMEHVWTSATVPPTFYTDFPKATVAKIIRYS